MHELSVARSVVRTVVAALPDPDARVTGVRLRVGALSSVVPEALAFAWDAATDGSPLGQSELVVETVPIVLDCPTCGAQKLPELQSLRCPVCGELCGEVSAGDELEIADVTLVMPIRVVAGGAALDPIDETTRDPAATPAARILATNDQLATDLRGRFARAGVRVSNWVSAPGTGKTELLAAVLAAAAGRGLRPGALVGDCATDNDAKRLAGSGALVRQIVTDGMCHLEADLIGAHLAGWDLAGLDLLAIENVGNLVCPSDFDLGESLRVVLLSVTEGEDKALKYPQTFHRADLVVITKTDLAGAATWDRGAALAAIAEVNPTVPVIETSARSGEGVEDLLDALLGVGA